MAKKTPLYESHLKHGGKIVDFGGFLLPVQYAAGIVSEHNAVRNSCGIFDVSHMGEAILEGPDALKNLNYILTNDFTSLQVGAARYSIMLYEDGFAADDLIVYRLGENRYLLVLNASNTEKDIELISSHLTGDVKFSDISQSVAQIAVQGPNSKEILSKLGDQETFPTKYYTFSEHVKLSGHDCMVARTGYTGEFGYELYFSAAYAEEIYEALIAAGALPCGLGARDTLRLEAGMPLYGHELSDKIDPITAGLGFAVKLAKDDFIGKSALPSADRLSSVRVGLEVIGRGIVREHQLIFSGEDEVGITSSGTFCPFVGKACAMAYVKPEYSVLGTELTVDVRGNKVPVRVVELPFYKSHK